MSDLVSNTARGVLAEFLVGSALGVATGMRLEWEPVDFVTPQGRIEVKSAAYVQAWEQENLSNVQFSVALTRAWDRKTRIYESESKRQADVYVFALLSEEDRARLEPLDLSQWEFYVLAAKKLNDVVGHQKSISLGRLLTLAPRKTGYFGLADAVNECLVCAAADAALVK